VILSTEINNQNKFLTNAVVIGGSVVGGLVAVDVIINILLLLKK